MSLPYAFARRTLARRRRVLTEAISQLSPRERKRLQAIYDILRKDGYGIGGYASQLEDALKYVRRAEVAINALEGNSQ